MHISRLQSPATLNISRTSILFVSISFIVLMIISLTWLIFYYIQRFRYAHAKERLTKRLANAAKKTIAKIPQRTIKSGDKCTLRACLYEYKSHFKLFTRDLYGDTVLRLV
eukprot:XP_014787025.1 PREDICTED: RING finger protein 150-like [Octopus bimaculoides]